MARRTWLLKSEPEVFSLDDLRGSPRSTTTWDGVRNYQARNLLRDEMSAGDRVLFYHSNGRPPAAVGVAMVARGGYPDETQFDAKSPHFDPDADRDAPRWYAVDVRFDRAFPRAVTLDQMRVKPALAKMVLLRKDSRLSVQPVSESEWKTIAKMAGVASS